MFQDVYLKVNQNIRPSNKSRLNMNSKKYDITVIIFQKLKNSSQIYLK